MNRKLLILLGAVTAGILTAGSLSYASYIGSLGAGIVTSSSTANSYSAQNVNCSSGQYLTYASSTNTLSCSTPATGAAGGVATTTPFTAGYLPFASSSLALTNSTIYESTSTNDINIATTTDLGYALGVNGSIDATGGIYMNGVIVSTITSTSSLTGVTSGGSPYTTALGVGAAATTTGISNTFIGYQAGNEDTTGNYNTANGYESLYSNTTGFYNTANGVNSLYSNTTGYQNTANGYESLYSNITGGNNTANGYNSLAANTTGNYNTANGVNSLLSNTAGYQNTANGYESLYSNTTGKYNTANGVNSLYSNTGNYNTANGYESLYSNTTGFYNTANGVNSLLSNTAGYYNTANGYASLTANTTGGNNTANGVNSLLSNTTGNQNTADGFASLSANTTGGNNTANGYNSLAANTTGSNNVGIGNGAGNSGLGVFNGDVFIGTNTGGETGSTPISYATDIGNYAGTNEAGGYGVSIGNYAGSNATGSNLFYLGDIQQSTAANDQKYSLLYGNFAGVTATTTGQFLDVNGHLGSATSSVSVTSCGTGSPSVTGSDNGGVITAGTVATTCTLNFASAWTYLPSCVVTSRTASIVVGYSVTTSTLVITNATLGADVIDFRCMGNPY